MECSKSHLIKSLPVFIVVKCLLQPMPKNLAAMTVMTTTRTLAGIDFLMVLKFLQKENDKSRDLESFIISLKNIFLITWTVIAENQIQNLIGQNAQLQQKLNSWLLLSHSRTSTESD